MSLFDAIRLATRAHAGQTREDGSAYIEHPLTVLRLLWRFNLDLPLEAYIAAILHDALEDTHVTYEELHLFAGSDIAAVVRVLTKDDTYYALPQSMRELVYLKRIASINQMYPYALLIKMADRLHNLSTCAALPIQRRKRLLHETQTIYLPFLQSHILKTDSAIRESYQQCAENMERILSMAILLNSPAPQLQTSLC
jgi:guanosine-3',5'-bis(diphosphate) 3'-pyrophosphohydrolase